MGEVNDCGHVCVCVYILMIRYQKQVCWFSFKCYVDRSFVFYTACIFKKKHVFFIIGFC